MIDWDAWLIPDEEKRPDHRPICHACGERIDGYTVYVHYAEPYHRECLKEIFEEEAEKEIEQMLRDAACDEYDYRV